jgi:hypothetical protein
MWHSDSLGKLKPWLFKTPIILSLAKKLTIVCFFNNHLLNYQTHKIAIWFAPVD